MFRKTDEEPTPRTQGPAEEQHNERLQDSVGYHFYLISTMWTRITNRISSERFGLSAPELRVLRFLSESPGATNSGICQAWNMDKAVGSRALTALAERGLIVKVADTVDRRLTRLKLSAAGEELIEQTTPIRRARMAQVRAALEPDEYETLFRVFAKIEALLEDSELLNERSSADYYKHQVSAYLDDLGVGKEVEGEGESSRSPSGSGKPSKA